MYTAAEQPHILNEQDAGLDTPHDPHCPSPKELIRRFSRAVDVDAAVPTRSSRTHRTTFLIFGSSACVL